MLTEAILSQTKWGAKIMRGVPTWVWIVGGAAVLLFIVVPYLTGQPFLSISGGGFQLPSFKLAGAGAPAQSTSPTLV